MYSNQTSDLEYSNQLSHKAHIEAESKQIIRPIDILKKQQETQKSLNKNNLKKKRKGKSQTQKLLKNEDSKSKKTKTQRSIAVIQNHSNAMDISSQTSEDSSDYQEDINLDFVNLIQYQPCPLVIEKVPDDALLNLSRMKFLRQVCCVCDALYAPAEMIDPLSHDELPLETMAFVLQAPDNLPITIIQCYDVSFAFSELTNCLVSPRGFLNDQLQFCRLCYNQLTNDNRVGPPKFSIANGNYVGSLPEHFLSLSQAEISLVSMGSYITKIINVQGGIGKKLVGHSTVFLNVPGPPITVLPVELQNSNFYVVFGGAATEQQKTLTKKKHLIHYDLVYSFLRFLKENNLLYK